MQNEIHSLRLNFSRQITKPKQNRIFRKNFIRNIAYNRDKLGAEANDSERKISRRIFSSCLIPLQEIGRIPSADAVMGMTAGRVPGFSKVDSDGFRVYSRPEAKSGGHGVGWSEITPYSFRAKKSWEEIPVSIADPGGTEIDAKFSSPNDGEIKIILAPILRFSDQQGDVDLRDIVSLQNFIKGFAPELMGASVQDENIVDSVVLSKNGRTYYNYELLNHTLISATSWNKRIYILIVRCNSLQWRKSKGGNISLLDSFQVNAI